MKGVSIAMETIIYIILAVTVLTVLLFFFTSQAGPTQTRVELENKRAQLCGQYAQADFQCDSPQKANPKTVSDLVSTCKSLDVPECPTNAVNCIQRCCITCPKKPS